MTTCQLIYNYFSTIMQLHIANYFMIKCQLCLYNYIIIVLQLFYNYDTCDKNMHPLDTMWNNRVCVIFEFKLFQ